MVSNEVQVAKDLKAKKLTVTRNFNAELETVWDMWTKAELLDLWWAPKPWKTETKSQSFKPGGKWIYSMVGPNGERHFAFVEYSKIEALKTFAGTDAFSDENGVINTEMPRTTWNVSFQKTEAGTKVTTVISATQEGAIEKMLEMGFEQGFLMAMGNLEEYLKTHAKV